MIHRAKFRRFNILLMLFLLLFIGSSINEIVSTSTSDEVEKLIQRANKATVETFSIILDAEKAGADVSDLLVELDLAVNDIFRAELDLLDGNGVNGQTIANIESAITITSEISLEASTLKNSALSKQETVFRSNLINSVIGVSLFIVIMFGLWFLTKKLFYRKVLNLKPEAALND